MHPRRHRICHNVCAGGQGKAGSPRDPLCAAHDCKRQSQEAVAGGQVWQVCSAISGGKQRMRMSAFTI